MSLVTYYRGTRIPVPEGELEAEEPAVREPTAEIRSVPTCVHFEGLTRITREEMRRWGRERRARQQRGLSDAAE